MEAKHAAVFLDRDGTIIDDVGFIGRADEVRFYDESIPALLKLQQTFRLFIVTNQSGIGRGAVTREQVDEVNRHVLELLAARGVVIDDLYMCPHRREAQCACHKPKPLFLQQAAAQHGIDLARSFVIGDHPHDVDLARNAGCTGVYVLTGHGSHHVDDLSPGETVLPHIGAAADWILARGQERSGR